MKRNLLVLSFVLAISGIWLLITLPRRLEFESQNDAVEIAVEFNELKKISDINNYPLADFLDRLKSSGITTVVLDEETPQSLEKIGGGFFISNMEYDKLRLFDILTEGSAVRKNTLIIANEKYARSVYELLSVRYFPKASVQLRKIGSRSFIFLPSESFDPEFLYLGFYLPVISKLKDYGFYITLRPINIGKPEWLDNFIDESVSSVIFESDERFHFQKDFAAQVNYIDFEFYPSPTRNYIKSNRLVRGHKLSREEQMSIPASSQIIRFIRAVKERGIRYLLINFDEKKSIDENLTMIKILSKRLKNDGYRLTRTRMNSLQEFPLKTLRKFIVLILSILLPMIFAYFALFFMRRDVHWLKSFLILNTGAIFGSVFTVSFVSSPEFVLKLDELPGVKFVIFTSLLLCVFVLFSGDELRKIIYSDLTFVHLLYVAVAIFFIFFLIARTGNISLTFPGEIRMRELLENILYIRPRWKEILVGQPFLLLGLKYKNKFFLLLGSIAAISIVNTFWHVHTPLTISLYRTLLGVVTGGSLGFMISIFYSALNKKGVSVG